MKDEVNAILDDLLSRWHFWAAGERHAKGFPHTAAGCRLYRCSRQYDDETGALDASVEDVLMAAIDAILERSSDPARTALYLAGRNACTGESCWASPRLPSDATECAAVVAEARAYLLRELQGADLL
jgi:hypothetical protein